MGTTAGNSAGRTIGSRRAALAILAACLTLLVAAAVVSAAVVKPTAVTVSPDADSITDTYALISGVVNPQGNNVSYEFQWGKTTAYDQQTPLTSASNGKAEVPVDYSLDDLKPSTTYHYRIVASGVGGSSYLGDVYGADVSFTTSAALAVHFVATKVPVAEDGDATVTLKAVGPPDETADGQLKLVAKVRAGRSKHKLRHFIGTASYSIATGKTKKVHVHLSAAARKALRGAKSHRLAVTGKAKTKGLKLVVAKLISSS
jgi:hypothetical protein